MICSKCKIFSIHLPNFDSYICEFGHVFCSTCAPKPYSRCSICNGRIVRRAELLIEGVPKTIFHQTPTDDCNQMSDMEGDVKLDSDSDENWSRVFDYRYSEFQDYPSNNESPRHYACEMIAQRMSQGGANGEMPRRIPSNHDARGDYNDGLRQRRSACHFKSPSNESIKLEDNGMTRDDPKNLYQKTLSGNVSPDFDPMKDYYDRIAQVNTIHEYYKRPNLVMATKSSSKTDLKMGDENMSDSSTLIQHLSEFRKATNYQPPSNLSAYKVNGVETMSEPAIITTSKTRMSSRLPPLSPPSKLQETYSGKKTEVQVLYTDPRSTGSGKSTNRKVDVGTMMDFCLTPSANPSDLPAKEPEFESKTTTEVPKAEEQEVQVSTTCNASPNNSNLSPNAYSQSLRAMLREQLRNQVYSQFDSAPKKPQNVFMVKGYYNKGEMLPPRSIEVTSMPKVSKLSDAINSEVEKALKNLAAFPKLQHNGSQRREEIVKQSKNLLRQRILEEVYSRFEKNSAAEQNNAREVMESNNENQTNEIEEIREVAEERMNSVSRLEDSAIDVADNQSISGEAGNEIEERSMEAREKRTVGMSTESYPKLNPDLNVILPSKASTQKSQSIFCPEEITYEFAQEFDNSYVNDPNLYQMPMRAGSVENDVVNEILEQFQRNVTVGPPNTGIPELQREIDMAQYERVLRMDVLSPNSQPITTNESNRDLRAPEVTMEQGDMRRNENQTYPLQDHQQLGDNRMQEEQIHQNVYFFQQQQQYMYSPMISPPEQLIAAIGDDCTKFAMKTVARNLMEDFREEPRNANDRGSLDISKFIQFIKDKFPSVTLKQLKQIILNLPTDEPETDEVSETVTKLPPPATFRADYDKYAVRTDTDRVTTDQTTTVFESSDYPTDFSVSTVVTAWRAHFCPPIDLYVEPIPQFKPISRFDTEVSLIDHIPKGVKAAAELNLPRNPITCPVTACSKLIFVSEFSKHIKMDHVKIPVETLIPGRCRNLFLDPKSDEYGINKCHILYLVTNKIRDLGSKEFKDYLPLLVMATKVSLLQLISPLYQTRSEEVQSSQQNYLMIWLTGLCPQDLPIYFSLTAWHRFSTTPKCHIVHSGRIYSIRNKHDDRSVYNSGNALLLSQNQVRLLTNNGQDMIELQIIVH